ncbi:cytochrome P450 [Amycolatopsis rubida]|uniref:Cytochrome P450 n=1 Tax=Amycolatopsis rubida TaxID=112413 RepID=A0ABX0BQ19_9PSEU|nr:cytochrome P450 [Amycolatopsis rubida]NEC57053.1 cytochrome P450 [Amycolatopsis rubida]
MPRDDMLSDVIHAGFGERQVLRFASLMVAAGQLTTTDAAATMALLLAENPDLRDRVRDSPKALDEFIEEAVRHEPAVAATGRAVTQSTTLGGVPLDAGDRVLLAWGSANRDERHFNDGGVFRPERGRTNPAHLGCPTRVACHVAGTGCGIAGHAASSRCPAYGVIRGVREVPVEWSTTG